LFVRRIPEQQLVDRAFGRCLADYVKKDVLIAALDKLAFGDTGGHKKLARARETSALRC
jgi:hypothetical protein